ncbi:hypothetical protein [Mycolicibacterium sp. CBMA 234]|uniref:hypothetical protein n=1 Tax=Mycolicibacterium sp. CBMA 234 TaxID=1918495 RepID=UPI001EE49BFC|nr:hypothetical protein [Mycolicibacterium sp. CBMA 234]
MTNGVALIGASAIALSPIVVAPQQVHLPAIPVSSIATTLTAQVDPISAWVQVLTASFSNISALGQQVWADPAPILKQILTNQLGYANTTVSALSSAGSSFVTALQGLPPAFQQAAQQMAAGHIDGAVDTAFTAVLQLVVQPGFALLGSGMLDIPGKIAQNIANVVKQGPFALAMVGFSVLGTLNGVQRAFGDAAQAVYDGVRAGNLGATVNAIINAPAVVTNAFLNGYAPLLAPGILTPGGPGVPGVFAMVIQLRDAIAQALGAPVPAAAAAAAAARDTGPSAVPSAALSVAAVTLGAEKVTTPDAAKVGATKVAATETTPVGPAATAPAATGPAAAAPAATSPETPSPATETKPESGATSGSTTTPNGGTDATSGTKTGTPGTAGEPTKPSGATGSETGSSGTTTPNSGTDTSNGGTKTGTPGKTGERTKPTKPSGSTGSETGSSNTGSGSGATGSGTKTGTPGKSGERTKPTKPTKPSGSAASGTGSSSTGSGSGASHAAA